MEKSIRIRRWTALSALNAVMFLNYIMIMTVIGTANTAVTAAVKIFLYALYADTEGWTARVDLFDGFFENSLKLLDMEWSEVYNDVSKIN